MKSLSKLVRRWSQLSGTTRIHVLKNNILKNLKRNTDEPVIAVRQYKNGEIKTPSETVYCHRADILDESGKPIASVVYGDPLRCGARVWIETELDVQTHGRG